RGTLPFSLAIAGGGDAGYSRSLAGRIVELGLASSARMVGEVAAKARRELFENADVVVVPSFSENFGMVVAEALAHAVPVIASRGTPWRAVERKGCGLWVDNNPESLADAILRMNEMPLADMGRRGRQWVGAEFGWDQAARKMMEAYESVMPPRGVQLAAGVE